MRAFLEQTLQTLPTEGIVVCVAPAPLVSLDSFLLAPLLGEVLLWRSPSEEWSFVGFGVSAQISTRGSQRFLKTQEEAQKLFQSISLRTHPLCETLPPLRLFGGASFQVSTPQEPWKEFADADFILPRWCYAQNKERAFLTLSFSVHENTAALLEEARELETFFVSPRQKTSPTPQKISLTEQARADWTALVQSALCAMQEKKLEKVVLARCSKLEQEEPLSI
jgi:isochorismate synthase EntC